MLGATESFHLAVPGKHFGLALILVFSDRCGKSAIASSATGSAMTLFPRWGKHIRCFTPLQAGGHNAVIKRGRREGESLSFHKN